MRMWMVPPEQMCRQHMIGEHSEIHMFVGHIRKGRSVKGYLDNNLLEPLSLTDRHEELVLEMRRKGYRHYSSLSLDGVYEELSDAERDHTIDREAAKAALRGRCTECRKLMEEANG